MSSLSGQMAKFAIDLKYADIPDISIWEAKRFLLDSIGCALAAVNNEDMAAMYRFIEKLGYPGSFGDRQGFPDQCRQCSFDELSAYPRLGLQRYLLGTGSFSSIRYDWGCAGSGRSEWENR